MPERMEEHERGRITRDLPRCVAEIALIQAMGGNDNEGTMEESEED